MRPPSFALRAALTACALLAFPAVVAPAAPEAARPVAAAAVAPPSDSALTARLEAAAHATRRQAGRESLYARGTYLSHASRVTSALVNGNSVPGTPDRSPMVQLGGTSSPEYYESQVTGAIDAVIDASHDVLAYPLHTDGGWSVRSTRLSDGRIRWGVALVVGWPDPPMTSNTGCSAGGYCWSTRGLNPHLPWTRNVVTWHLSTSGLPSGAENLMKAAVAQLNRVPGLGADVVYGGLTSATAPTASNRFVVVWGSGCSSSSALGCTFTGTQGSYNLIYQTRVVITRAKYLANPNAALWVGTLIHEMSHGLGLGHYDGPYLGSYQNMRWANGPNAVKAGDANGLRAIAPGGRVGARLRAVKTFGGYTLYVTTANNGFGGIRSITTQCTGADGAWEDVATTSGRFDGRVAERQVGSISTWPGSSRQCRAYVRSKTSSAYSSPLTLAG